MIAWLTRQFDAFIGAGEAALTVPMMDGALKPNRALDDATGIGIARPDCLARDGAGVLCSSGNEVWAINGSDPPRLAHRLGGHITAMCAAPGGGLALALETGEIRVIGGARDGMALGNSSTPPLHCVTAMAFASDDALLVCVGSKTNALRDWRKDLLEAGASGSLWRVDITRHSRTCLADSLAFPYGLLVEPGARTVLVSESWRHRVLRVGIEQASRREVVLDDLPGYPARLDADGNNGAWLSIFAPRNQLVEFVIREPRYRDDMMRTIAPDFWIAPALRSRDSFLEPLQGGGVRQMGKLKPWAPTRSYGLVVRLGGDLQPVSSLHSRADGSRHGTTSCLLVGHRLFVASKGGNEVLVHAVAR